MVAQPLLPLAAPTTANQLLSYVRSPGVRATTNRRVNAITGNVPKATSTCSPRWSMRLGGRAHRRVPALVLPPTGPQVRRLRQPPGQEESNDRGRAQLITIAWHVLTTGRPYQDLGADYFAGRLDPEIETRRLVAKLQAQGYTVTLEPAA